MADTDRHTLYALPETMEKDIRDINQGKTHGQLNRLAADLSRLGQAFQTDKTLAAHVKMITALVAHLKSSRSGGHPEAVPTLTAVFRNLKVLVQAEGGTPDIRRTCLSQSLKRFNALKDTLAPKPSRPGESGTQGRRSGVDISEIENLKAILFSIDWEISDASLGQLNKELTSLKNSLRNDTLCCTLLQMIQVIGRYIGTKRAGAHKEAIPFCHTLYNSLEDVLQTPDMTSGQRKRILSGAMAQFDGLKAKIASTRNGPDYPVQPADRFQAVAAVQAQPDIPTESKGPVSPIDDLISTKSGTQSPVDDLVDQIHLLHVFDESKPGPVQDAAADASPSPDIREIIPNRRNVSPIQEIEARLDDFFDEDQLLSELSFADTGEKVVPYEPVPAALKQDPPPSPETGADKDESITPYAYDEIEFVEQPRAVDLTIANRIKNHLTAREPGRALETLEGIMPLWEPDQERKAILAMLTAICRYLDQGAEALWDEALEESVQLCACLENWNHEEFPLARAVLRYTALQERIVLSLSRPCDAKTEPDQPPLDSPPLDQAPLDQAPPEPVRTAGFLSRLRSFFGSGNG
ncbi:MAG: hypothetical protein V1793_01170 [Pseudomonadota bacterium]